jgi:hypothetical protein
MTLSDTLASLLRRWYVVLLGFALTCGLGWATYQSFPPRYETSGSILLMPADATVGDEGNPYLFLGGMNDALDILIRRTNASEVQEQVLANYAGASYTAERDAETQSPIIVISAEASSAEDALQLLTDTLTVLRGNLINMQAELSIPEARQITMRDLVINDEAVQNSKMALQLSLVVLGAGFVGTLMATGLVDNFISRRSQVHSGRRPDATVPDDMAQEPDSAASPPPNKDPGRASTGSGARSEDRLDVVEAQRR